MSRVNCELFQDGSFIEPQYKYLHVSLGRNINIFMFHSVSNHMILQITRVFLPTNLYVHKLVRWQSKSLLYLLTNIAVSQCSVHFGCPHNERQICYFSILSSCVEEWKRRTQKRNVKVRRKERIYKKEGQDHKRRSWCLNEQNYRLL